LPKVIRSDYGKEFCDKAMVTWAHERGVRFRLIEPDKPNQNAYIELFTGRFRDECLNEHWFPSLLHPHTEIEIWRIQRGAPQEGIPRTRTCHLRNNPGL
jgi:putative transposase